MILDCVSVSYVCVCAVCVSVCLCLCLCLSLCVSNLSTMWKEPRTEGQMEAEVKTPAEGWRGDSAVKVLHKPGDPSLKPRTHKIEEDQPHKGVLGFLHACHAPQFPTLHTHTYTHTHSHTNNFLKVDRKRSQHHMIAGNVN